MVLAIVSLRVNPVVVAGHDPDERVIQEIVVMKISDILARGRFIKLKTLINMNTKNNEREGENEGRGNSSNGDNKNLNEEEMKKKGNDNGK